MGQSRDLPLLTSPHLWTVTPSCSPAPSNNCSTLNPMRGLLRVYSYLFQHWRVAPARSDILMRRASDRVVYPHLDRATAQGDANRGNQLNSPGGCISRGCKRKAVTLSPHSRKRRNPELPALRAAISSLRHSTSGSSPGSNLVCL